LKVPGTPVFLDVSGTLDSDYQIIVLTRESRGFLIRNGEVDQNVYKNLNF